ncbi:helix-turn-helix domain-containing protein [Oscillospiraceae bacterium OttesenSCG-928-F05]|nr:helix-turn-helix domain-containing protein [Oscillospiraceae bacterium OttesenSCG-928-F05]
MDKNICGQYIRKARLAEKPRATQSDISARLAVLGVMLSASSIGKIENGTRPVTDIQLKAFAEALRVSTSYLLGE